MTKSYIVQIGGDLYHTNIVYLKDMDIIPYPCESVLYDTYCKYICLFENKIPISKNLANLIKNKKLNKINLITSGDDYQVLFTANINKARIIQNASKTTGIKITKIGKIVSGKNRSLIFDEKDKQIQSKYKGYIHQF